MIVGCYSLHLYCDNMTPTGGQFYDIAGHRHDEFPHEFTNETRQGCFAQARARGWILNYRTDKSLCPKCSKKASMPLPITENKEKDDE